MKTVSHIFQRKGTHNITVSPDTLVFDALKLMADRNIGSVVIMEDDKYCGLFTERDYARKVILHGKSSSDLQVAEIMSEYLPQVSMHHQLDECMEIMTGHNIRYLPVFDQEKYIGIISIIDVVRETILDQKETIDQLHHYINS
ncbi:MAG: CBS domain-containing protein [Sphingobacteriales bacterium]|jgi:CBS domain-containing protein